MTPVVDYFVGAYALRSTTSKYDTKQFKTNTQVDILLRLITDG